MPDQTIPADPSSAEAADVFNGENVSLAEYSRFRTEGELPERFQVAEKEAVPAPAEGSSEGEKPESGSEAEPAEQQEKPQHKKLNADERISQLRSTVERLWQQEEPDVIKIAQLETTIEKIEQRSGKARKTEPAPVVQQLTSAQPAPSYQEWRKTFKATKWMNGFFAQNPDAPWEDANAAMADHLGDVRESFREREQVIRQQTNQLQSQVDEARTRYGDAFDEAVKPALQAISADKKIPDMVKAMLGESENLSDLLFTLGSDPKALDSFIETARTKPGQALRHIAILEAEIRQELEGKPPETPAKTQTAAPRPPSPVGGVSSRSFDVSDDSLSPEEWARKRTADLAKRGKH